jgi:hypothetical protein
LPEFAYKIGTFNVHSVIDWNIDASTGEEFITFIFPKKVNINECKLYLNTVSSGEEYSEYGFLNSSEKDITFSYSHDGINWVNITSFKYGSIPNSFDITALHFKVSFHSISALKVENIKLFGNEEMSLKKHYLEYFQYNANETLPRMFKNTKIGELITLFLEM